MSPKFPSIPEWPDLTRGKQPVIDWAKERGLNLYDATQPLDPNRIPNFRNQTPYPILGQTNLPPIPTQNEIGQIDFSGPNSTLDEIRSRGPDAQKWKDFWAGTGPAPQAALVEERLRNNPGGQWRAEGPLPQIPGFSRMPEFSGSQSQPASVPAPTGMGKEAIPGLNETALQTGNPLEDMFPQGMGLGANYADLFGG